MPVVLERLSRRELLGVSLAAAAGALARPWTALAAEERPDPHRFALLSDTHIPADRAFTHRSGVRPWDHFEQVRKELLALTPQPAGVLIGGDCAYMKGRPEDYARFVEAVQPLRAGGLPLHLALGNHDRRDNFFKALPPDDTRRNAVADRYVGIVRSPRANWFILDSLILDHEGAGALGEKQLAWLAQALDANTDKPALILVHHHPDTTKRLKGLEDTPALLKTIVPRKQVKAWIYGHTHLWAHGQSDGVHFVNLPATAWVFLESVPAGWVDVKLGEHGATFELVAIEKDHPQHGQKLDLKWR